MTEKNSIPIYIAYSLKISTLYQVFGTRTLLHEVPSPKVRRGWRVMIY